MRACLGIRSPPPAASPSIIHRPAAAASLLVAPWRLSRTPRPLAVRRLCWDGAADPLRRGDEQEEDRGEHWPHREVRTLLIDNYDSYTYNIYQELSVVNGVPPVVIYNDEWTWDSAQYYLYDEKTFDNIVISPGPGSPAIEKDVGICLQILRQCEDIPILGVCLGHQSLGFIHGAQIVHAIEPVHGRLSEIEHNGCNIFADIPSGRKSGFKVVRYHSLVIDATSVPKELIPTAWTSSTETLPFLEMQQRDRLPCLFEDETHNFISGSSSEFSKHVNGHSFNNSKVIMGIKHVTRPHYGVQFHPESVATCHGRQIFLNFKKITVDYGMRSKHQERKAFRSNISLRELKKSKASRHNVAISPEKHSWRNSTFQLRPYGKYLKLQWKKIDSLMKCLDGPEYIFCELYGDKNAKDTFWLDSSSKDMACFSFMGGQGGSLWKQITYQLSDQSKKTSNAGGYLSIRRINGFVERVFLKGGFFEFLDKELQSLHYDEEDFKGLPFDFCGGFIGFIGYNLKIECGASLNRHRSTSPDACFFFVDNFIVIDHHKGDVYIMSIRDLYSSDRVEEYMRTEMWLAETEKKLLNLKDMATRYSAMHKLQAEIPTLCNVNFVADKSREEYIHSVEKCQKFIRDGESYELCLTTQMRRRLGNINPLAVHLNLRNRNPAPYAAWLNFAEEDLCICCSSPERFLRLDKNNILEAKPIKGTIARGGTLEEDELLKLQLQYSEKDQAENLMIVDLLRNDLGRVCVPGSVHVARLMEVETYAFVHTLVSTIQGKRKPSVSPVGCVRAAFPGGSMTGAPKLRSMEILDSLESHSRGVYSGSIGYFSYNQTFDLNIVIRSLVVHKGEASVGAGGAVVALSDPEDEFKEMLLKARAPINALGEGRRELGLSGSHSRSTAA